MVIYPAGRWYAYKNKTDIDQIIDEDVLDDNVVEALLLADHSLEETK